MSRACWVLILCVGDALAWEVEKAEAVADQWIVGDRDAEVVGRIGDGSSVDVWLVVDALVRRGRAADAERLIGRLPESSGRKALGRYVTARRDAEDSKSRTLLASARSLRLRGKPLEALARLRSLAAEARGVLGVVVSEELARAHAELDRVTESREEFLHAARLAHGLGWNARCRAVILMHVASHLDASNPYWSDGPAFDRCQALLAPHEALLALGAFGDEVLAVVVLPGTGGAQFVPLGPASEADGILRGPYRSPDEAEIAKLRDTLAEPLLRRMEGIRHLFVVPQERFARVPWAAVVPEYSVTCVPMNCLWGFARDPAQQEARASSRADDSAVLWIGRREDALGIVRRGTVELANEREGLESALGARPWAAIHLSCDPDDDCRLRPRTGGDPMILSWTGFLRSRARADLVIVDGPATVRLGPWREVDSALRFTPPGDDEGPKEEELEENLRRLREKRLEPILIVGEVSPRAIVSLWPQDADARSALLRTFYDEWLKSDPAVRFSAVEVALRAAQQRVRAAPAWSEPRYWAGWQAWGAPGGP